MIPDLEKHTRNCTQVRSFIKEGLSHLNTLSAVSHEYGISERWIKMIYEGKMTIAPTWMFTNALSGWCRLYVNGHA